MKLLSQYKYLDIISSADRRATNFWVLLSLFRLGRKYDSFFNYLLCKLMQTTVEKSNIAIANQVKT